jgi:hypothetical protein
MSVPHPASDSAPVSGVGTGAGAGRESAAALTRGPPVSVDWWLVRGCLHMHESSVHSSRDTCAPSLVCLQWPSLLMVGREALWVCVWMDGVQAASLSAMCFEQRPPIHPGKLGGLFVRARSP